MAPAKQTTTTAEHREGQLLVLFMLLTFNSGLVMYISRGDLVSVASAGVTYVAVGLLLGRLCGCWVARQLDAVIWILFLLLGVLQVSRFFFDGKTSAPLLQVSRLARTPTAVPMLVAVAGAAALVVGGCCSYMLHRRSWSKQQRQEEILLQLRQDTRN